MSNLVVKEVEFNGELQVDGIENVSIWKRGSSYFVSSTDLIYVTKIEKFSEVLRGSPVYSNRLVDYSDIIESATELAFRFPCESIKSLKLIEIARDLKEKTENKTVNFTFLSIINFLASHSRHANISEEVISEWFETNISS